MSEIKRSYYPSGQLAYEIPYQNNQRHGIEKSWHESGKLQLKKYYLYNEGVSKEEYRKHELVEKLSWLK